MFERRPSPAVLTIGGTILIVGALLILTGRIDHAALVAGFIPLRVGMAPVLLAGVPWLVPVWLTPLSAVLVHDGWLHLGFNLLSLLIVATPTQRAVGVRGLIVLLVIGAYGSVAAEWAIDPQSAVPMIGATGAISAVIGAYALLFGHGRAKAIGPVPAHVVHALWLGISWTVLNLLIAWASAGTAMPVAGAAHVGGFLTGMVLLRPLLRWRWSGVRGRVSNGGAHYG